MRTGRRADRPEGTGSLSRRREPGRVLSRQLGGWAGGGANRGRAVGQAGEGWVFWTGRGCLGESSLPEPQLGPRLWGPVRSPQRTQVGVKARGLARPPASVSDLPWLMKLLGRAINPLTLARLSLGNLPPPQIIIFLPLIGRVARVVINPSLPHPPPHDPWAPPRPSGRLRPGGGGWGRAQGPLCWDLHGNHCGPRSLPSWEACLPNPGPCRCGLVSEDMALTVMAAYTHAHTGCTHTHAHTCAHRIPAQDGRLALSPPPPRPLLLSRIWVTAVGPPCNSAGDPGRAGRRWRRSRILRPALTALSAVPVGQGGGGHQSRASAPLALMCVSACLRDRVCACHGGGRVLGVLQVCPRR